MFHFLSPRPLGKLGGKLSSFTAPQMGAHVIEEALSRAGVDKKAVEEAYMGNVVSAGIGQAPTRQAVIYAGLDLDVPSTTINKVCASGMKATMMAAQSIGSGYRKCMIAGGMESMSNIPYYLPDARAGHRMGNKQVIDGIIHDGLWDIYNDQHMGMCGELCADKYGITREQQDAYATASYERALAAWDAGKLQQEIAPMTIKGKRGKPDTVVDMDEEYGGFKAGSLEKQRPAFKKDGSVTAGNSSGINDGACAMVLMSGAEARARGTTPLFKIRGFGDAAREPTEFTVAPADAVPRAFAHAGVSASDIDYHEINEAFSVVALANAQLLNLNMDRLNVNGGAVAMGHPIGCSGARIIGSLYHVLQQNDASLGCASICNGGGGASAVVIERLN